MKGKLALNPTLVAMLVIAALGVAFWLLLLGPRREEAQRLGEEVERAEASLAAHRAEVAAGLQARAQFPRDYRRLVVLGKAVPASDDVGSLLVQLNRLAARAGGSFRNIALTASGGEAAPQPAGSPASPTEAEAALLPLGATIGPAGLGVMPYSITLDGNFFEIADFIAGLDSLVRTKGGDVVVDGRLLTIDSFELTADRERGFPALEGSFSVTSFLTPPGEGAAPEPPTEVGAPAGATPASASTGAAP